VLFSPREKRGLVHKTRNFIWPRKGLQRAWIYIWHRVTRIAATPHVIALGFACGAFASFTPFVGFHFILAGIIAFSVGGSVIASALGTSVGNPLTFPFIWVSTYEFGSFLLGKEAVHNAHIQMPDGMLKLLFTHPVVFWDVFWGALGPYIVPMIVGSIPLGILIATICYVIVRPAVDAYQATRKARIAKRRKRHLQQGEA